MNLAHIIDSHPADATALVSRGRTTTYGSLREQVAAARGAFAELGVSKGDVVVLLCGNSRYFVVAYLAALGLGAVVCPLNPTSPAPELEREIAEVSPVAVVIEPAAFDAWKGMHASVAGSVRSVIATEGHRLADAATFEEMLRHDPVAIVEVDESHPAVYMFTSGTAGSPKAAVITHGNLSSNIAQTDSAERLGPNDVVFGVLPVHHIFGLNVVIGLTLAVGASVVLVQRFDPVSAMETLVDRGVTVIPGAPSMWIALAQLDHPSRESFAGVRLALSGASKLPEHTANSLNDRFGLKVREGYGLTEASPVVTSSVGTEWFPGSVGVPVPGCEVRVVDEDEEDVLVGDTGEIWVRGPNVFAGYLGDAEATSRVLTADGWLRTGDVGVIDEEGRLFIVDRAKDLIIVSGFNVFPAEVESAINTHPDVVESTVIGTAHPHTGESVRAYVVLRPGVHLDEDALIDHCRARLARYKCPSKVLYVDSLPRNLVGKVQRYALR
ncbi:MAG: class I adenylate-forming enzyme family protein [Ilumatobacteraceae bacterium]